MTAEVVFREKRPECVALDLDYMKFIYVAVKALRDDCGMGIQDIISVACLLALNTCGPAPNSSAHLSRYDLLPPPRPDALVGNVR